MKYRFAVFAFLAMALPASAQDDIRLLASGAARAALGDLLPPFEAKTHMKVTVTFGSAAQMRTITTTSDDFDAMVVQPPLTDILAAGHVAAKSQTALAIAPVALVVKTGTPHPDLSSPDSLKKALLAAKSISYPDPAGPVPVGASFHDTLTKLGIVNEMEGKTKLAAGGPATLDNVLKGDAEIGIDFMSEADKPGIDIVGALPAAISTPSQLVGFVTTKARDPEKAATLIQFLSSPEAAAAYRAHGMIPAK
jgi:molybdate transport system substrate-binding protein